MKLASLVGANHAEQYPGSEHGHTEMFCRFLEQQATASSADLLAEEMNLSALARAQVSHSTVQRVATALMIRHVLCDPNETERRALGIPSYEELKMRRNFVKIFAAEEALLEEDERCYWPVREREWLDSLTRLNLH